MTETNNYTYNDAGQVVKASYADGTEVDYLYDASRNRVSRMVSNSPSNNPPDAPVNLSPADQSVDVENAKAATHQDYGCIS